VIQAKGYKVDKQGDIKGNGHAKRDVVEWMIPPLWPWKFLMLPARGPRPTLKGEEPMQLRLMDDIVVPRNMSASAIPHLDRPPYASSNIPKPTVNGMALVPAAIQQSAETPEKLLVPASETLTPVAMSIAETASAAPPNVRMTILVLKSNQILEVTKYRIDSGLVSYQELNGKEDSVDSEQIDWRRTTQMTAEVRSVDLPAGASQIN